MPYRTLALDLCPQSIGRAPRLLASPVRAWTRTISAPVVVAGCEVTLALPIKHAPRALIYVPFAGAASIMPAVLMHR